MHVDSENGQQMQRIGAYLYMFLHCMNYAKIYADIILQGLASKRSVLGLACESTFWHNPSMPHCLSWLCMLSVLSSNLSKTLLESFKSLMITELSVNGFAKLTK